MPIHYYRFRRIHSYRNTRIHLFRNRRYKITDYTYINRHSLTVNGSDQDLNAADLLAVAAKYDIRSADATLRHVAAIVSRYREFGEQAGVAEQWIRMIEAEISALRL